MGVNTVILICGPTASGKTAIAIDLALKLKTEIISADSRQCYHELNVGAAKPTGEELALVKHHFINEFSVNEEITAADFEKLGLHYLDNAFSNNQYAIVCGGTGLYIKALLEGLDAMPSISKYITDAIELEYAEKGKEWLQNRVKVEDPEFFLSGEIENPARMIRALAFKLGTGDSILQYRTHVPKKRSFKIIKIGLELEREILYARINKRVDLMMEQGLLEEVKNLYPLRNLKNLQTVGYTEIFEYLDGKYSLETAVEKIKQNTRRYAKRQLTWFRKDTEIQWLPAADSKLVSKILGGNTFHSTNV